MTVPLLGVVAFVMLLAAPVLLDRYLRQLPEAPACPRCHAVARTAPRTSSMLSLPLLGRTFIAECRCGWRGRMRWRWARESTGGHRPT